MIFESHEKKNICHSFYSEYLAKILFIYVIKENIYTCVLIKINIFN